VLHDRLEAARRDDEALPDSILHNIEVAASDPRIRTASYDGRGNERVLRALVKHGLSVNCWDIPDRFSRQWAFWREDGDPPVPDLVPPDLRPRVVFYIEGLGGGDLMLIERHEPGRHYSAALLRKIIGTRLPEPLVLILIGQSVSEKNLLPNYDWRLEPGCAVGRLASLLYPGTGENVGRRDSHPAFAEAAESCRRVG
jgi:hypothetical protein